MIAARVVAALLLGVVPNPVAEKPGPLVVSMTLTPSGHDVLEICQQSPFEPSFGSRTARDRAIAVANAVAAVLDRRETLPTFDPEHSTCASLTLQRPLALPFYDTGERRFAFNPGALQSTVIALGYPNVIVDVCAPTSAAIVTGEGEVPTLSKRCSNGFRWSSPSAFTVSIPDPGLKSGASADIRGIFSGELVVGIDLRAASDDEISLCSDAIRTGTVVETKRALALTHAVATSLGLEKARTSVDDVDQSCTIIAPPHPLTVRGPGLFGRKAVISTSALVDIAHQAGFADVYVDVCVPALPVDFGNEEALPTAEDIGCISDGREFHEPTQVTVSFFLTGRVVAAGFAAMMLPWIVLLLLIGMIVRRAGKTRRWRWYRDHLGISILLGTLLYFLFVAVWVVAVLVNGAPDSFVLATRTGPLGQVAFFALPLAGVAGLFLIAGVLTLRRVNERQPAPVFVAPGGFESLRISTGRAGMAVWIPLSLGSIVIFAAMFAPFPNAATLGAVLGGGLLYLSLGLGPTAAVLGPRAFGGTRPRPAVEETYRRELRALGVHVRHVYRTSVPALLPRAGLMYIGRCATGCAGRAVFVWEGAEDLSARAVASVVAVNRTRANLLLPTLLLVNALRGLSELGRHHPWGYAIAAGVLPVAGLVELRAFLARRRAPAEIARRRWTEEAVRAILLDGRVAARMATPKNPGMTRGPFIKPWTVSWKSSLKRARRVALAGKMPQTEFERVISEVIGLVDRYTPTPA